MTAREWFQKLGIASEYSDRHRSVTVEQIREIQADALQQAIKVTEVGIELSENCKKDNV